MRGVVAFTLLLASMVMGTAACEGEPKVSIVTRDGKEVSFAVEIADTPAERERGLQYRRELAEGRGMIFLFPREEVLSFWMRNTPIPLDMIFINAERKVVGIVENATPFSLQSRSVPGKSQYVLEINGGLSRRHGLKPGDSVRFEGFTPATAQ